MPYNDKERKRQMPASITNSRRIQREDITGLNTFHIAQYLLHNLSNKCLIKLIVVELHYLVVRYFDSKYLFK